MARVADRGLAEFACNEVVRECRDVVLGHSSDEAPFTPIWTIAEIPPFGRCSVLRNGVSTQAVEAIARKVPRPSITSVIAERIFWYCTALVAMLLFPEHGGGNGRAEASCGALGGSGLPELPNRHEVVSIGACSRRARTNNRKPFRMPQLQAGYAI